MTGTWPDDLPGPYGREPDFPRAVLCPGPDPEVTVVRTRHRGWKRVPGRPNRWQPLADRGPMPEFERSWVELVARYDVWLDEPTGASPASEGVASSLLPPPPPWHTRASTLAGTWQRGPGDVWLKLDSRGRETTYGLTWDQLQRVPGAVRTWAESPTGRLRLGSPPPLQHVAARGDPTRDCRELPDLFVEADLAPLHVYEVLRGLVVSGDVIAGLEGASRYAEWSPVRARVSGIGEPDQFYSVIDVNPVRRGGRLTVELVLVPDPIEEVDR